jgi:hypothetical protein
MVASSDPSHQRAPSTQGFQKAGLLPNPATSVGRCHLKTRPRRSKATNLQQTPTHSHRKESKLEFVPESAMAFNQRATNQIVIATSRLLTPIQSHVRPASTFHNEG